MKAKIKKKDKDPKIPKMVDGIRWNNKLQKAVIKNKTKYNLIYRFLFKFKGRASNAIKIAARTLNNPTKRVMSMKYSPRILTSK